MIKSKITAPCVRCGRKRKLYLFRVIEHYGSPIRMTICSECKKEIMDMVSVNKRS